MRTLTIRGDLAVTGFTIAGEPALADVMGTPPGTGVLFEGLTFDFSLDGRPHRH